jgi:hypothetical protein
VKALAAGAIALFAIVLGTTAAGASTASTGPGHRTTFAFVSSHVAGAPTGAVALTGFGSYDPPAGFLTASGWFRCTDSVAQGPLSGCLTGQGVRWSSDTSNATQRFVCGTDAPKTVTTDDRTVAFNARFFRAGDGSTPSFTANVIVSAHDIAPDVAGIQHTWIQGVGCGNALRVFGY